MAGFFKDNPPATQVGSEDATESTIQEDAVTQTDTSGGFYQGSPDQTTTDAYTADALASKNAAEAAKTAAEAAQAASETAKTAAELAETNASTSASTSTAQATNSAASESASAASAAQSASSASQSASSASSASASETAAASSATSASNSSNTSTAKAGEASVSASNAATSEANASSSASTSTTQATNSAASASSSLTAKNASEAAQVASETAESNAASSATSSASSATSSASSATSASTSASNAASSASAASTSETNAASSETNAATSATASAASASSASAAKDAALAALDNFDDRYLGQKASDPSVDNDGNALITGALYFDTTNDVMRVYDGSQWLAAYADVSGSALTVNNLSDLANAATARTNLGLGTAATTASSDYATAAQADQTVALTGGSGITTSGTYPNFTITNSDPDQTVALTGSGATTVSGTYPNFTITSTDTNTDTNTTYTAGSGITLTGTVFSNSAPDQTVALTGSGGTTVSGTYPNFTISSAASIDGTTINPAAVQIGGTTVIDSSREGSFATRAQFGGIDSAGNVTPSSNNTIVSGYGLIGNRGTMYVTNNGKVQIGNGSSHNTDSGLSVEPTVVDVGSGRSLAMAGTTVIDSSRNLTNIGTLNGGTPYTTANDSLLMHKGADIPSGANLNNYTTIGFYHQNSNSSAGAGSNYPVSQAGMLTVTADGVMVYQTYHRYSGNHYYHRSYYNGTWYPWRLVWTDGNDGSGSGLDADTCDGQHLGTTANPSFNTVQTPGANADVRFSVWSGTTYGIGMTSGVTLGHLNDYAMTFCMNNEADRGFWWGYSGQGKSAGAMSLTTGGKLWVTTQVTTPDLYIGDGNDGVFYSDSNGRTAFANGDFYIQTSVTNYYNYATNQYIGNSSGNNIYFRGNTLSGNGWSLTGAGILDLNGGHGALNITNSSILSSATSTWTGNPGGAGKIQYHSNRWYIVGDSSSNRLVQFRRDNSDKSYIDNNGALIGGGNWYSGNDGSGSGLDADLVDGIQGSSFLRSDATDYITGTLFARADIRNETAYRDHGVYGHYDSYKTNHIWSMGSAYRNHSSGANFGNLYGAAYTYSNRVYTSNAMANGHQMVWCQNGSPTAAMGTGLWTSGNVTAYSDIRVKTNLEIIPNALEKVQKLNGYTFDRTDVSLDQEGNPSTPIRQTGVVAQEVLEVLPEAVTGDEDSHYNVAYGNMVGLLIEAIKELKSEVDDLKQQLEKKK